MAVNLPKIADTPYLIFFFPPKCTAGYFFPLQHYFFLVSAAVQEFFPTSFLLHAFFPPTSPCRLFFSKSPKEYDFAAFLLQEILCQKGKR